MLDGVELVDRRGRSPSADARGRVMSYSVDADRRWELVKSAMVTGEKPW